MYVRIRLFLFSGENPRKKNQSSLTKKNILFSLAPHPSPLSAYRGFFGSQPFSKINLELTQRGIKTIDWRI